MGKPGKVLAAVLVMAFLFALIPATAFAALAASGTCGAAGNEGNVLWSLDESGALTISGSGAMADYDYPNGVMSPWNAYRTTIQTVTISGVTNIGSSAFYDCSALTFVTIPASVTAIGESAFELCESLTSAVIPDSVTAIGDSAFSNCYSLTSAVIPDSVTAIGDSAFSTCLSLASVTLGNGVTTISKSAFYGTAITSIIIPNNVTLIDEQEFYCCYSLTSIVIPDSVTTIGHGVFMDCPSLTSVVIGNGVTAIGTAAFFWCRGLTSVVIPNSVTMIGSYAFEKCSKLTSVIIPNSVTTIDSGAFDQCYELTSITIPGSVTLIAEQAFQSCDTLKEVIFTGNTPPEIRSTAFNYITSDADISSVTVRYPGEAAAAYESVLNGTFLKGATWMPTNSAPPPVDPATPPPADPVPPPADPATPPPPAVISVSGVTLNKTALTLAAGGTETLTAAVAPGDAANKSVTWSSSSPSVAAVDAYGKVTAIAAGSAVITVTTADGGKTASCQVTVTETKYPLTVQAGTGGSIRTGESGRYAAGASVSIAASAKSGYIFGGWTATGGGTFANAGSASTIFTMPTGAATVTANFVSAGGEEPPASPAPAAYPVITSDAAWTGSGDATFTVDAPFEEFVRLTLGGNAVGTDRYTAAEGSTVITLKESYLNTLDAGTYTFRAEFTDGYTDLALTVAGAEDSPGAQGGSGGAGVRSILLLSVLVLGFAGFVLWRRRR